MLIRLPEPPRYIEVVLALIMRRRSTLPMYADDPIHDPNWLDSRHGALADIRSKRWPIDHHHTFVNVLPNPWAALFRPAPTASNCAGRGRGSAEAPPACRWRVRGVLRSFPVALSHVPVVCPKPGYAPEAMANACIDVVTQISTLTYICHANAVHQAVQADMGRASPWRFKSTTR